MTWFKVDDKLHDHRKTRVAGKAAMGVWALAGSWASDHGTDGFIPAGVLGRWGSRADATKLVAAGLWEAAEQDGEKGWRFHDWNVHQPDAASVRARRQVESEAGARGNHVRWHEGRGVTVSDCSFCQSGGDRVPDQVSDSPPSPPSRPDPSPAAAAAAAATLPGPLDVLRSKLQAHTPLRALRFDDMKPGIADRLLALVDLHGDDPLVRVAIDTCRNPPPVHVGAFLGTWEALPAPGTRGLSVVRPGPCTVHGTPRSSAGVCSSCAADQKAGNA